MPQSSRPPPRDPLGDTWPDDPHGVGLSDRQIEYVAKIIERLEAQIPSAEDRAYLRRKREEDEHMNYLKAYMKEHWPRVAVIVSLLGALITGAVKGIVWLATHRITISGDV